MERKANFRPKIAMILGGFPASTFILREVHGLKRKGIKLEVFCIRKAKHSFASTDTMEMQEETTALFPLDFWAFVKAHLFFIVRRPYNYLSMFVFVLTRRYTSTNFVGRDSRFKSDRIRSAIHFLEAVYLAHLIRNNGDITHIHAQFASHPATLAMVASRLLRISFSFTAHAYDIWFDRLFLEEKVNAARFVITCSAFGKSEIIHNYRVSDPDKIAIVYHGVDTHRFSPRRNGRMDKHFTILTVGRLSPEKSQHNLVHACRLLKERDYIFHCFIVGDGPLLHDMKALVAALDLTDVVTLVGHVAYSKMVEYYHNSDVFVLTSETEGLPNVLLESLATGTPVITTDIAGVSEAISDGVTGLLIQPNNITQLCAAIEQLMSSVEIRTKLSLNGRAKAEKMFDQEKCLDQLVALYRNHGLV